LDFTVSLLSPASAAGLTAAAGGSWNAERGLVLLTARDCAANRAANVSYSLIGARDSSTYGFYTVQSYPSSSAKATEENGYGGLVNVFPSIVTNSATLAANTASAHEIASVSLLVRAGFITISDIAPTSL
jgi:hypothetical protein